MDFFFGSSKESKSTSKSRSPGRRTGAGPPPPHGAGGGGSFGGAPTAQPHPHPQQSHFNPSGGGGFIPPTAGAGMNQSSSFRGRAAASASHQHQQHHHHQQQQNDTTQQDDESGVDISALMSHLHALGGQVYWASVDPRSQTVVEYDAPTTKQLEDAFLGRKPTCPLVFGNGARFNVELDYEDVRQFRQKNRSGGARRVIRVAPPTKAPAMHPGLRAHVHHLVDVMDQRVKALMQAEKGFFTGAKLDPSLFTRPVSDADLTPLLAVYDSILENMWSPTIRARYGFKFQDDAFTSSLRFGNPIPPYFANVHGSSQSIWQRKMLSILGLRNLLKYGFEIFAEMKERLFAGDLDAYDRKKGPNKMKYFTGNVVDLDCTILRAHEKDVLAMLNNGQKLRGEPEFASGADIARTEHGRRIVANLAATLIDDFLERFNIAPGRENKQLLKQRCLLLTHNNKRIYSTGDTSRRSSGSSVSPSPPSSPAAAPPGAGASTSTPQTQTSSSPPPPPPAPLEGCDIAVATDHKDRGKTAVWVYENVGLNTFHVNVPNMDDVYGALLKAPYHLAQAYCLAHEQFQLKQQQKQQQQQQQAQAASSSDSSNQQQHSTTNSSTNPDDNPILRFYEDALNDSCFNAKWKQIELFLDDMSSVGTISQVLDELQAARQDLFTPKFFDADDDKGTQELALMIKLVEQTNGALKGRGGGDSAGAGAVGAAATAMRSITKEDVVAWHKKRQLVWGNSL